MNRGAGRTGGLGVGLMAVFLPGGPPVRPSGVSPACDSDNGGITLPAGFCAVVVADQVGAPRHLAVAPNGDLFVAMAGPRGGAARGILPPPATPRAREDAPQQSIGRGRGPG